MRTCLSADRISLKYVIGIGIANQYLRISNTGDDLSILITVARIVVDLFVLTL
jgi:hypothetical protein